MIEFRSVTLQFGEQVIFRDLSFRIEAGEIFVLIGPSGSGKSSLLKLVAGLIEPSQGEVWIHGKNLKNISTQERIEIFLQMGMLFQKNALFDSLTAAQNIAFPLTETTDLSTEEIAQKVDYYLHAVGLSHAKPLFPDEISGGMQKRLGIARALALEPQIIIYDDPTAGLDPITSKSIVDLILKLQQEKNSTVIAVTNDMNRAFQMADQVAMLVDGECILLGDVTHAKNHKDPRVHQFLRGSLQGPLTEYA
jgi:phospholipid/cholesterol/gamma-HCH transport system ATP-binding protein